MNELIDMKMTKGYKANIKLYNGLDLACNDVKNIIMSEIVFEAYKPSKSELNAIVSKKINSLFDDITPKMIENARSSFEEMYYNNEEEKVKWYLKRKATELDIEDVDNYVDSEYKKFQGHVESAASTQTDILIGKYDEIKKSVIATITNDCYSLIYSQVPNQDVEKMKEK